MQLSTLVKLGSLAFGVANNDKVRELWKIAHNGAKRRGVFDPPAHPQPTQHMQGRQQPRRPFW